MAQMYMQVRSSSSRIFDDPVDSNIDIPILSDSVYVFPSPPTADPDSHSNRDSLDSSPAFTSSSGRPSLLLADDYSLNWDEVQTSSSSGWHSRTTSFGSLLPPRQPLQRHSYASLRARSSIDYFLPLPRFQIPFLSFILSFLSIDETLVQLLTRPSSSPTLFPGNRMVEDGTVPDDMATGEIHGVDRLLCPPKATDSLKEGLEESTLEEDTHGSPAPSSWTSSAWSFTKHVALGKGPSHSAG